MTKLSCMVCALSLSTMLCSCVPDRVQFSDRTAYGKPNPIFASYNGYGYSPGFTGQTQGYDGYGDYDDGFGPSFWNPRYYFYTGSLHGYGNGYDTYPYPHQ